MQFYDIDTFCVEDYGEAGKDNIKTLVNLMNDYTRLSINTCDALSENSEGRHDVEYKNFYTEKYGEYKTPDSVMNNVVSLVKENEGLAKPCMKMFDRVQTLTGYSNPCSIRNMMYAMGEIAEKHKKYILDCKNHVAMYLSKYIAHVGYEPNHDRDMDMLFKAQNDVNNQLSSIEPRKIPDGVKTSKPNRWVRQLNVYRKRMRR